jgi:hypothetical protein
LYISYEIHLFYSVSSGDNEEFLFEGNNLTWSTESNQIVPIKHVPFKGVLRIRAEGCNNVIKWTNSTDIESPGLVFGSVELGDSAVHKRHLGKEFTIFNSSFLLVIF